MSVEAPDAEALDTQVMAITRRRLFQLSGAALLSHRPGNDTNFEQQVIDNASEVAEMAEDLWVPDINHPAFYLPVSDKAEVVKKTTDILTSHPAPSEEQLFEIVADMFASRGGEEWWRGDETISTIPGKYIWFGYYAPSKGYPYSEAWFEVRQYPWVGVQDHYWITINRHSKDEHVTRRISAEKDHTEQIYLNPNERRQIAADLLNGFINEPTEDEFRQAFDFPLKVAI